MSSRSSSSVSLKEELIIEEEVAEAMVVGATIIVMIATLKGKG